MNTSLHSIGELQTDAASGLSYRIRQPVPLKPAKCVVLLQSVAGFAVLSGRILPELEPRLASKARLAHLKAFIGHGELDSKLPVQWAHRSVKLLGELGVDHWLRLYPMDHGISADMHADFLKWIKALG